MYFVTGTHRPVTSHCLTSEACLIDDMGECLTPIWYLLNSNPTHDSYCIFPLFPFHTLCYSGAIDKP